MQSGNRMECGVDAAGQLNSMLDPPGQRLLQRYGGCATLVPVGRHTQIGGYRAILTALLLVAIM